MRVWIDITNSPHVPFFRPLIRLLEEDGHEVDVTARAFAQTEQLLELHGIDATIVGAHGGRSRFGKSRAMASRLRQLRRWAAAASVRRGAVARLVRPHADGPAAPASRRRRRSTTSSRSRSISSARERRRASSCRRRSRQSVSRATACGRRSSRATPASRRSTTSPTSSPIPASPPSSASIRPHPRRAPTAP